MDKEQELFDTLSLTMHQLVDEGVRLEKILEMFKIEFSYQRSRIALIEFEKLSNEKRIELVNNILSELQGDRE